MSRQMKGFADYFMQGMQMGAGWAEKWQAGQIAKERNRLAAANQERIDKREQRKLDIYQHGVMANADLARARAANVGKGKGGGGGKAAGPDNPGLDALHEGWRQRDVDAGRPTYTAPVTPVGNTINVTAGGSSDDGAIGDVPQPPVSAAPVVESDSRGGKVGSKRYASGGIVEGMSLEEAKSYQEGFTPSKKKTAPATNPFGSAVSKAVGNYKPPEEKKNAAPDVRPTGPQGTGVGGSYTTADVQPGGVLDTRYRAGGMVSRKSDSGDVHRGYRPKVRDEPARAWREPEDVTGQDERFISGAPRHVPQSDSGQWYAEGGKVRYAKDEEKLINPRSVPAMAEVPVGRGRLQVGANYDPNSRYGQAEAGYEHPVGRNTTLGVHGNIGKDLGPEGASAKPDWGVGIRGRVRFAEGGMVESEDLTKGYDWKAAEKEREAKTQRDQTQQVAEQAKRQKEEDEYASTRGGSSSAGSRFASAFESASANGATGSGGDSTGGVSGTGGVGGSATGGQGGSAAAGVGGDDGGTYRRGGSVRRFQSGGRVMRDGAIDTGTSGPGSGYGYRAPPPGNAQRRY